MRTFRNEIENTMKNRHQQQAKMTQETRFGFYRSRLLLPFFSFLLTHIFLCAGSWILFVCSEYNGPHRPKPNRSFFYIYIDIDTGSCIFSKFESSLKCVYFACGVGLCGFVARVSTWMCSFAQIWMRTTEFGISREDICANPNVRLLV